MLAAALVGVTALATGCGGGASDAQSAEACRSYDASLPADALVISPQDAAEHDEVQVSRADGRTTDWGNALLYSDRRAGCRVYALSSDGDGPQWEDVTGAEGWGSSSLINPNAASQEYAVPATAESGRYLLCIYEVSDPECGRFTR